MSHWMFDKNDYIRPINMEMIPKMPNSKEFLNKNITYIKEYIEYYFAKENLTKGYFKSSKFQHFDGMYLYNHEMFIYPDYFLSLARAAASMSASVTKDNDDIFTMDLKYSINDSTTGIRGLGLMDRLNNREFFSTLFIQENPITLITFVNQSAERLNSVGLVREHLAKGILNVKITWAKGSNDINIIYN